ncbi:MAG: hypothetical protein KC501_19655 [Myxococcales bacterium]|nr:hypothetical protein [Myxococcales bacterium]
MSSPRGRSWRGIGLLLLVGCGREPAPLVVPDEPLAAPAAEPAPSAPTSASSGAVVVTIDDLGTLDIGREPHEVSEGLAELWCRRGGSTFRPPSREPDDQWPPRLDSCDDAVGRVSLRREGGGIVATTLELDSGSYAIEEQVLLLLQSPAHAGLFTLEHSYEMEEVDPMRFEIVAMELRDVMGTAEPELIVDMQWTGGDSFEADHCYAHEHDTGTLVVCTEAADGFRCLAVAYRDLVRNAPRTGALDDCGMSEEELGDGGLEGHSQQVELRDGAMVLGPSDEPIDEPRGPRYSGEVSLEMLLDEAMLEPLASGPRS